MPLNQEKVIQILKDQTEQIEDRYDGYSKELFKTVAEIVMIEQEHAIARTNIVEKIKSKIELAADELYQAEQK